MNAGRISQGATQTFVERRAKQEEKDQRDFAAAAQAGRPQENESFITQVVAARQPPPLTIAGILPEATNSSAALFGADVSELTRQTVDDVTGDLAEIYLTHADGAKASGDAKTAQAFEYLGELMLQYEHLRQLRTRDLG